MITKNYDNLNKTEENRSFNLRLKPESFEAYKRFRDLFEKRKKIKKRSIKTISFSAILLALSGLLFYLVKVNGFRLFNLSKDINFTIMFVMMIVGLFAITLALKELADRPKLPSELSEEEEEGLQHYLKVNEEDFTITKLRVDGQVRSYREVGDSVVLGFSWDNGVDDELDFGTIIENLDDTVVGLHATRRVVFLDYPEIGRFVASDKLLVYEPGSDTSKLNKKNLRMVVKKDRKYDGYSVQVNY